MKDKILELFKKNMGAFLSGQKISEDLGVSRAAIWKYINLLKLDGYIFESSSKKGYMLISSPDALTAGEINDKLTTKFIGRNLIHYDTIDSTNINAKLLASSGEADGTVIISEEQTSGKGRLGRHWISPKYRGIWMSIILRPDINPIYASRITIIGAAAVFKAMKSLGINSLIKWPNDIVLNNKKVCGILTEMSAELNRIHYLVMGIGINVNVDKDEFPEDLRSVASSLKIESGSAVDRKTLVAYILNNFEELYDDFLRSNSIESSVTICRENSVLIGREVRIINGNKEVKATAVDINNDGELLVKYEDGKVDIVFSGEVSVRGLYGYV